MTFRRLVSAVALLAGLMALPAAAMVTEAYTTGNVNVRSGPGTGYARIGMLYEGTRVDLRGCDGNWRNVYGPRLRGWVSANYLDDYVGRPRGRSDRADDHRAAAALEPPSALESSAPATAAEAASSRGQLPDRARLPLPKVTSS